MHKTTVIAAALLIIGVAALGVNAINATTSRMAAVASTSNNIDVLQMMRDAKDLPVQHFDAF